MQANSERPSKVDMSPEAIGRRLRELGQLYKLGMSLKKARRIGKVEELQQAVEEPPKKQGGDTP
jgi:hypothetical protein